MWCVRPDPCYCIHRQLNPRSASPLAVSPADPGRCFLNIPSRDAYTWQRCARSSSQLHAVDNLASAALKRTASHIQPAANLAARHLGVTLAALQHLHQLHTVYSTFPARRRLAMRAGCAPCLRHTYVAMDCGRAWGFTAFAAGRMQAAGGQAAARRQLTMRVAPRSRPQAAGSNTPCR